MSRQGHIDEVSALTGLVLNAGGQGHRGCGLTDER